MIVKMEPDEIIALRVQYLVDTDPFNSLSVYPIPTRAPTYSFPCTIPLGTQLGAILRLLGAPQRLDDAAIQVYKDGDYGAYLDLESSLAEQAEEIEGLDSSRKNSLVVRTQLSVRVHAIIEKLLSSEGSELRRALFSLKQIFQEDKDLVHGFVALGGLNCLVRVGNVADQNYQNYILRALGQVMLYVDGMNGVMKHSPTIQWLYSLIASKYRLVVKTALKLLLVFVEYVETNCTLLVQAVHKVDKTQGTLPWSNIMKLLKDYENADTELLIYATSLINKTLSGLSDQDSFYDESDFLEQQGMEGVVQRYMSRPGTDLDLLDQLQLYEAVLKFEDGETDGIQIPDKSIRKTLRLRNTDSTERRKSRRHSTGTSPSMSQNVSSPKRYTPPDQAVLDEDSSSSNNSNEFNGGVFRECKGQRDGAGVTPGLRRRRERAERQKSFMREQQEALANGGMRPQHDTKSDQNGLGQIVTAVPVHLRNGNDSPPGSLKLRPDKAQPNNNNNSENCTSPSHVMYSPGKNALSNTSISVISNSFEKKHSSANGVNGVFERTPLSAYSDQNGLAGKRVPSDFVNSRNLANRTSNAAPINGVMKHSESKSNILSRIESIENSTSQNNNAPNKSGYLCHKRFENDSNRLNNYYNQLSTTSPVKNNNFAASILNQKNSNLNGSLNCNGTTNANTNGGHMNGSAIVNKNNSSSPASARMNGNYKDIKCSNGVSPCHSVNADSAELLINAHSQGGAAFSNGNSKKLNGSNINVSVGDGDSEYDEKKQSLQIRRDHTVKDLTQKLTNLPTSPQEDKPQNRIGDMTGLISKAKEGLAKSKSKGDISRSPSTDQEIKKVEPKKSENELHWEELVRNISRPLRLCDLDFTDLNEEDENDVLAPRGLGGAVPPPPPPIGIPPPISGMGPPPFNGKIPPPHFPPPPTNLVPPPNFGYASLHQNKQNNESSQTIKKNKKTVKLFWKEVREDMIPPSISKTIWDELPKTVVDVQKLEHLFESRAKDLMTKKQQELNKNKEIIVLDHKRSNAINIAMTKLPPPRAIKAAILKMDQTVVTREGIDKLLNMLPSDEERAKIQEAQMANPELPLGSAEQFLLTLSSISELSARLRLWAFKLDFENTEKEIAEPLNDLKQGLELLKANKTFKCILSTLLSIGIFLNGTPVKGFQIEYLAKVPEVKDTVHKHSLLHHLCHMVMESSPDTTDLYSEIGPITRASKADFTELAHNIAYLETECKASWDRLKLIAKHDCPIQLKQKLVDFLADCAERIIILQIVHKRVINRYRKFLLWLGVAQHRVAESKPNEFCRVLSEFALEYRTTRERVQQQIEKKANHRERNKTRGKMIVDVGKFRTQEDRADAELKQLLGSTNSRNDNSDGTLTWRRRRAEGLRSPVIKQNEENFTDGDDEIIESLVKTAMKGPGPRPTPRERKRTRHADRKSLRRTLKNGLTEEEKQHVASLIKTY